MTNLNERIALGIDIGGTEVKAVALRLPDVVLGIYRLPSDAKKGPAAVRSAVGKAVQYFRNDGILFSRIGMGCAGSVDSVTGVVLNSPNFSDWRDIPLRDWIEEDFHLPVTLNNDANCATFTEWTLGNARGSRNAVLLTFGTGVGGGLILNQQLYRGSTGTGGEIGHFSLHADGRSCPCGNQGCFERYCSGTALQDQAPGHTAKEIFERAEESPFKELIEVYLKDLKIAITSLANIFDPDTILLGGAMANGIEPHLNEIRSWVKARAFPAVGTRVKIVKTRFGNESGAMGAALLAFEKDPT
jgi:glucokinase